MSLEPIDRMMRAARDEQYAVGYFESWNLDSLQGAIEADEKTHSPIIIGWGTIGRSVQKTGRAVIVEEGAITGGVGAEIAAGIAERWPGVRVTRVASPDVPVPFTPVLENAYRPDKARIFRALRESQ